MQDEKRQNDDNETSENSERVSENNRSSIAYVNNYQTAIGDIKQALDKNVIGPMNASTLKIDQQMKAMASQLSVPNDAMKALYKAIAGQMAILEKPEIKDALNKLSSKQVPVFPKLNSDPLPGKFAADDQASTISSVLQLGQMIRRVRESRKLTQQEFADLAGVGRRFLSEIENGKATAEFGKVLQVARSAGIDIFAKAR